MDFETTLYWLVQSVVWIEHTVKSVYYENWIEDEIDDFCMVNG